jgi:hypothetical protein
MARQGAYVTIVRISSFTSFKYLDFLSRLNIHYCLAFTGHKCLTNNETLEQDSLPFITSMSQIPRIFAEVVW